MNIRDFILRYFINYGSENSFAFKLRKKRSERIRQLIEIHWERKGSVRILDVGGSGVYWKIIPVEFLKAKNVHITVLNLPSREPLHEDNALFSFVHGDGCNLHEYGDKEFDIVHSNSVLEHVGNEDRVASFVNELKRVAYTCYLQTPNYWFPVEPHFLLPFFHWLPVSCRVRLLTLFNLGQFKRRKSEQEAFNIVSSINLFTINEVHKLFPDALFFREKFFFLTKSFMLINNIPE